MLPGCEAVTLRRLAEYLNLLANGSVCQEARPLVTSAALHGLAKDGGGVRPLAVGETLRRLRPSH